jgi:hypothetical protein
MSPAPPYEDELFTHPTEISGTVFVNDRVCIQTEEDQRVISVHGVVLPAKSGCVVGYSNSRCQWPAFDGRENLR